MPDDSYHYHRHGYYYDDDDLMGDWGLMIMLLFFFALVLSAALCVYTPGCGNYCYYDEERAPRRHVVRYEIVRGRDGEGDTVSV
jgi:hypothetical protein